MGTAEPRKRALFEQSIKPGAHVFDLGANVGYYSMMASRQAGQTGKIFAVEPSPRNLEFLNRHIVLNGIKNVQIYPLAISDFNGRASFKADIDPVAQRLGDDGNLDVDVQTFDSFFAAQGAGRMDVVKVDIEGAELSFLRGAAETLTRFRPTVFVETHDRFVPGVHRDCIVFLTELGFQVEEIDDCEILARPSADQNS
jgi:FkbM family methyltransferase